jgi:DNA-directed RNA polymerase I, II, and III subunit RPABC2
MGDTFVPSEDINEIMKNYDKKKSRYKTNPKITKYERTRVLSERTSQLISGSIAFIENPESYSNPYHIALKELEEKKIPFIIKRPYSNTFEYWKLSDLL